MALVIGAFEEFKPKQQGEFQTIAEGSYECTVRDFKPSKNGKGFQISYRIRKDVPQAHQNQVIFGDYIAENVAWKINALANYTGVASEGQHFETLADFLKLIIDKPIVINVKHEEFNYTTQARAKGYARSQVGAPQTQPQAPQGLDFETSFNTATSFADMPDFI